MLKINVSKMNCSTKATFTRNRANSRLCLNSSGSGVHTVEMDENFTSSTYSHEQTVRIRARS